MKLDPKWVCGFVDGEGCFSVSITYQPSMATNYQVLPEFVVVQHERDKELLDEFKTFFECGRVGVNHGDRMCYRVRALSDLTEKIIPFFKANPLQTKKIEDFEKFCEIIDIMNRKEHRVLSGLNQIRALTLQMNNRKKKILKQNKTVTAQPEELLSKNLDNIEIESEN